MKSSRDLWNEQVDIYLSLKFLFRWFCHFDDDQYVNVPVLVRKLAEFPADRPWYLGKPSIDKPLEILDRDNFALQVTEKASHPYKREGGIS